MFVISSLLLKTIYIPNSAISIVLPKRCPIDLCSRLKTLPAADDLGRSHLSPDKIIA